MLDYVINNKAIQGSIPISLLTNNPYIKDMRDMAKSDISTPKKKRQLKNYIGSRFGKLLVLKEMCPYIDPKSQKKFRKVECVCDF